MQKYLPQVCGPTPCILTSERGLTRRGSGCAASFRDLNGNYCLRRAVGFSLGMDHMVGTGFSLIVLWLAPFSLSSCLLYFFFSFCTFPTPSKAICAFGNHTYSCTLYSLKQQFLVVLTHFHSTSYFCFTWHMKHSPELSVTETISQIAGGDYEQP